MLPKVANHLLQHTSRAVAAGHAFKNVLPAPSTSGGLGGWSGASSSYGGSGAGAGGAKYHSSRQFYHGYTGAGRAVTQANSSATQDDEDQPKSVVLRRSRERSGSMTLNRPISLLKTVQLHARSKHTVAQTTGLPDDLPLSALEKPPPPTRRASTDPAAPQTVQAPALRDTPMDPEDRARHDAINRALDAADLAAIQGHVSFLRDTAQPVASVHTYNAAFYALFRTRRAGEPLNALLELYNDMVARAVLPTMKTYQILLLALTERDAELQKAMAVLERRGGDEAARMERYRAESASAFSSAMALFTSMGALASRFRIAYEVYVALLRCCAYHSNVDAAIQVYAHLERQENTLPSPTVYGHLMQTFLNSGDCAGAKEIFEEFVQASKDGRVNWPDRVPGSAPADAYDALSDDKRCGYARAGQLRMWHKLIETHFRAGEPDKAVGVLQEMVDSEADPFFAEADVPPPASSTFTALIAGFCRAGDVQTALAWFDRLLGIEIPAGGHPFKSLRGVVRPDKVLWRTMLDHLAEKGMLADLNRLYIIQKELAQSDDVGMPDAMQAFEANVETMENRTLEDSEALQHLQFVEEHLMKDIPDERYGSTYIACKLIKLYVKHHASMQGLAVLERLTKAHAEKVKGSDEQAMLKKTEQFKTLVSLGSSILLRRTARPPEAAPLPLAMRIGRLCMDYGFFPTAGFAPFYLEPYYRAKRDGEAITLEPRDWELLGTCTSILDMPIHRLKDEQLLAPEGFVHAGTASFLNDLKTFGVGLDPLGPFAVTKMLQAVYIKQGHQALQDLFEHLGPEFQKHLNENPPHLLPQEESASPFARPTAKHELMRVDREHDAYVNEWFSRVNGLSASDGYMRFVAGAQAGVYPSSMTLSRLINGLGRLGQVDEARECYDAAQVLLGGLQRRTEQEVHFKEHVWFEIEDSMIIALAHAGLPEAAHVHRARVLEQGGTPSADAYGALVQCVKDTTDDTANATALFQEALARGVRPNVYLYNTMISKLAKARKADYALELFQKMKAEEVRPTSVTYGAVIAACSRVGDVQSAEMLFDEMASAPNFKPRVPPYNTMMQLYTHIKPDRDSVLRYYQRMQMSGVKPSAHTYKLLLDAYGTIEPVDMPAMEKVFDELVRNRNVQVQSTHWSSLINAYGCVQKNLDKAIEIFESLASSEGGVRPDALTFEALMNVLVTLRRADLIPTYVQRLNELGIHMTAYIANVLVRGYAAAGQLEESRRVFEGLEDPPQGVAAPMNHSPHEGEAAAQVPADAPVYREPSTWEAMVRAELGCGNRDEAIRLLERLQSRGYPPAVYSRISGIMLEDSVSPWPSSSPELSSNGSF